MSRRDLLYSLQIAIERIRSIAQREKDSDRLEHYRNAIRELSICRRQLMELKDA